MVEKARGGRTGYWWEWSQGAKDSAPRGFNIQDYHFPLLVKALKSLCREVDEVIKLKHWRAKINPNHWLVGGQMTYS